MINPSVCLCMSVCLSASISLEPLEGSSRNFVCRSSVAVAQSSSSDIALRYVLLVLWMTSRLAVMGRIALHGLPDLLVLGSITCVTGAESDVYECLLQARLGMPTGRADIGLEPCYDSVAFLRAVQKDFEKVQYLLQLVIDRETMKRQLVCLIELFEMT